VLDLILFVLTAVGIFVPPGLLGLTAACQALFSRPTAWSVCRWHGTADI